MALSVPEVGAIYLDSAEFGAEQWNEWVSRCHEADKQCLLVMPHIFRDRAKEYFETHRSRLESAGFDGLVIRAWEELELVREWKISIPLVMDYDIYPTKATGGWNCRSYCNRNGTGSLPEIPSFCDPADTDIPDIYCILPLFSGCTGRLP